MGWTFYQAYGRSRIKLLREEFKNLNILHDMMSGNEYYAIVENPLADHPNLTRSVLVVLTSMRNGEFGYKDMSETCVPYYFNVNKKFLRLVNRLVPLDSYTGKAKENAMIWRKNCLDTIKEKKAKQKSKRVVLPPGTQIQYGSKTIILGQFTKITLKGRKRPVPAYQIVGDHRFITKYQVSKAKVL